MLDIIKKSIYLGLGISTATKEKVETLLDELIEKGKLAEDEKLKVVQEILDKIEKDQKEFKQKIHEEVRGVINNLGLATQKDIEGLKEIINDLEKKINAK